MKQEWKWLAYLGVVLGMLLFAVPRLPLAQPEALPTWFALSWLAFALLVVAALLHRILGVDEETRQELSRLKRYKRLQLEQLLRGKTKLLRLKR